MGFFSIVANKENDLEDFSNLANLMGNHFQIRDDLLNLVSNTVLDYLY
jgi:geranylgeranyl pyrophosphate synthase